MPRARFTLNSPAASAAPVPPAHTSACALPSATARAACTIEASGVLRTALTGSALFAIETGASTTSTPRGNRRGLQLRRRPEQQHPRALRRGQRGAGGDLGRAQVGAVAIDRHDRRAHRRLLVVVVVLAWSCVLCTTTSLPA